MIIHCWTQSLSDYSTDIFKGLLIGNIDETKMNANDKALCISFQYHLPGFLQHS